MAYPFAQHNLRWPCTFESTLLANFKSWAGNVPTGNATFFTAGITQVKQAFTGITTVAQISGSTSSWLFTGPAATFPVGIPTDLWGSLSPPPLARVQVSLTTRQT